MKVVVLGCDGYLGWPTCLYLAEKGHSVLGLASYSNRDWETRVNAAPLWPVDPFPERLEGFMLPVTFEPCDIVKEPNNLYWILDDFAPEAVIHPAAHASAPDQLMPRGAPAETQENNSTGTRNSMFAVSHSNPDIHIIKLGTMSEYGTTNIPSEEGWLNVKSKGRSDRMLFPKRPGSFYHLSKVHDSHNLEFACRNWGLRVTDLNQGIVYGLDRYGPRSAYASTSFHYDAIFGTVLNRFVVHAVAGVPLTVYGSGHQTRGFLNISDTLQCVELALENPAKVGEFRVFNQFTETFRIVDLAILVARMTRGTLEQIPNPRVEAEEHFYEAKHTALRDLGLRPTLLTEEVLAGMISAVKLYADKINLDILQPQVEWRAK